MNKLTLFTFLMVLFCTGLFAQDYLGGSETEEFYQVKTKLYEYWLDHNGLGKVLAVDKYELKKNDHELELFLTMRSHDPDTAAAMWTGLVRAYEDTNNGKKLVDELFRTFARMMEIPEKQGNVQIYVPHKTGYGYDPCFFVWIWEEDGRVLEESRINNCKAQPLAISVNPPVLKKVSNESVAKISNKDLAAEVFDTILEYARKQYEGKKYYERSPRVEVENRSGYLLKFNVSDLSKEVLHEEDISPLCGFVKWLGWECNDMRRERLEFTFIYSATDEGYLLSGELTGKFGSGVYRPRTKGYMDMEPDFEEDYLKPYVRDFQEELKKYLERP